MNKKGVLLLASNESRDTQRAELHKAIWGIADEVRGAIDAIVADLEG